MKRMARTSARALLALTLAALPFLVGCGKMRLGKTSVRTATPRKERGTPVVAHKLQAMVDFGRKCIVVQLTEQKTTPVTLVTPQEKVAEVEKGGTRFEPGFLILPAAPVQSTALLAFGAGQTSVALSTFLVRASMGTTFGAVAGAAGGGVYAAKIPVGFAFMGMFVALSPPLKWSVAVGEFLVEYFSVIPGAIDGIFPWPYAKQQARPIWETLMMPVNLDVLIVGNILDLAYGKPGTEPYTPYEDVTPGEFMMKLVDKWAKGFEEAWEFTWDDAPVKKSFVKAAGEAVKWGWDVDAHMKGWGMQREDPTEECLIEKVIKEAFDYKRYSLLPVSWGDFEPTGAVKVVEKLPDRRTELDPEKKPPEPTGVGDLSATIRAEGSEVGSIVYEVPEADRGKTKVEVPLDKAAAAFCLDDKLAVSLATRKGDREAKHKLPEPIAVNGLRLEAAGPHVFWRKPEGVAEGKEVVIVNEQRVAIEAVLKADAAEGQIQKWQLLQDGVPKGWSPADPGAGLGRQVDARPGENFISLKADGTRSKIQVVVADAAGKTTTSTVILKYKAAP